MSEDVKDQATKPTKVKPHKSETAAEKAMAISAVR